MMKLHLFTMGGEELRIHGSPAARAKDFMPTVEQIFGIPVECQRWIFEGRVLDPHMCLASEGLRHGAAISLVRSQPDNAQAKINRRLRRMRVVAKLLAEQQKFSDLAENPLTRSTKSPRIQCSNTVPIDSLDSDPPTPPSAACKCKVGSKRYGTGLRCSCTRSGQLQTCKHGPSCEFCHRQSYHGPPVQVMKQEVKARTIMSL
mmetsp:Transcript_21957/g.45505  ORF Transcript_21957/g.45505 Transcript_21957/m.45505 type:complete len:203 (+) Transcript_21957:1-609(+)